MDNDYEFNPMKGIIGAVVVLIVIVGVILGFEFMKGWKSVPVDKIGLHYTGGPIQGTHFKATLPPGTHTTFLGLDEKLYLLPSTQRTYTITATPGKGDVSGVDVVTAASAGPTVVQMGFEGQVNFKLNTNPTVIRQFFEQICLHDNCTDLSPGGGWDKMLDQYFRPSINQAFRTEAGKYGYEAMWHDPATRQAMQDAIGPVLADDINRNIGGQFFCGPDSTPTTCKPFAFQLQGANPPQQVIDQFTATAAATQNLKTVTQKNAATVSAAQADAQAQAARAAAPPVPAAATAYIQAQAEQACATNTAHCSMTIVIGPTGATVQVPVAG